MATPNGGWDGTVSIGGTTVAKINSWEASNDVDALEQTSFGDGYDRTFVPGLRNHTVTLNGYYMTSQAAMSAALGYAASTDDPAATAIILLTDNTTGAKEGFESTAGAIFTNVTVSAPADGLQTFSASVQISGAWSTYSTA